MHQLTSEQISDAASELGLSPAFLEKELFAVQALQVISNMETYSVQPIFTGGTSLSTAHNLIERFSEDIDFKLVDRNYKGVSHDRVCAFCKELKEKLTSNGFTLKEEKEIKSFKFLKQDYSYNTAYEESDYIRPHLQIEISGEGDLRIPPTNVCVNSLIKRTFDIGLGNVNFNCVAPVEIASDKISSLTWRVLDERITSEPQMMRHLYDLWSLKDEISKHQRHFKDYSRDTIIKDIRSRTKNYNNTSPLVFDHLSTASQKLKSTPIFNECFTSHVLPGLYGEKIEFSSLTEYFDELVKIFKN